MFPPSLTGNNPYFSLPSLLSHFWFTTSKLKGLWFSPAKKNPSNQPTKNKKKRSHERKRKKGKGRFQPFSLRVPVYLFILPLFLPCIFKKAAEASLRDVPWSALHCLILTYLLPLFWLGSMGQKVGTGFWRGC